MSKELVTAYLSSHKEYDLRFFNSHTGTTEIIRLIDGELKKYLVPGVLCFNLATIENFDLFVSANFCEFLQGFFTDGENKVPVPQALDEAAKLVPGLKSIDLVSLGNILDSLRVGESYQLGNFEIVCNKLARAYEVNFGIYRQYCYDEKEVAAFLEFHGVEIEPYDSGEEA